MKLTNVMDNDFSDEFINRLRTFPFVKAAAKSSGTPVDGGGDPSVQFEGDKEMSSFYCIAGAPEMMKVYGLKLKKTLTRKETI